MCSTNTRVQCDSFFVTKTFSRSAYHVLVAFLKIDYILETNHPAPGIVSFKFENDELSTRNS